MRRGVLQLSRAELVALMESFDSSRYEGMHLVKKLEAGIQNNTDPVSLEISTEELEILMDEVGAPLPEEALEMAEVRMKLNSLMSKFREEF